MKIDAFRIESHLKYYIKKANLTSLEQRRAKQLLCIMYRLAQIDTNIVIPTRNTRKHMKKVFRVENKIGTKYARSPFYKGTKLWDLLCQEEQTVDNIYDFKKCIDKKYNTFVKDFNV